VRRDTLHQNCVFSSGGMLYMSRSAFCCVQGVKYRCNIFHAQVGKSGFLKKCVGTHYAKLVFLHPVGSVSHVLNFGTFRARNIDALFFMLRWDRYGFHKKTRRGTIHRTCVFAFGVICVSRSALWCVWVVKCRHTIFMLRWVMWTSTPTIHPHLHII
jgi:hypothetical protein